MRRLLSTLALAAGVALCGAALLHYARGWVAQREARARFSERQHIAAGRSVGEDPGIVPARLAEPVPTEPVPTATESYPYGETLARLRIPVAQIDCYIFAGSDPQILDKGPGHVPGTAFPGETSPPNNCVITAHRDAHFRRLGWLRKGHVIELETPTATHSYRVVSRQIVTPDTVSVLQPTASPRLTLITCYPFNYIGPAPKRLVVVAEPTP